MLKCNRKIGGAGDRSDPGSKELGFAAGWLIAYRCMRSWASFLLALPGASVAPSLRWGTKEDPIPTLCCLHLWRSINLRLCKAFLSQAGLVNCNCQTFEMQLVWERKKTHQLLCCWIRILCSLWSNKLCLGSWIIPGCLGFCGSGFFRNCSHCRKVGVNLCLGCFSGHTLAKTWQVFFRGSAEAGTWSFPLLARWHTPSTNNRK